MYLVPFVRYSASNILAWQPWNLRWGRGRSRSLKMVQFKARARFPIHITACTVVQAVMKFIAKNNRKGWILPPTTPKSLNWFWRNLKFRTTPRRLPSALHAKFEAIWPRWWSGRANTQFATVRFLYLLVLFFTARCYARCLSICPSVTRRYSIEMAKHIPELFPSSSQPHHASFSVPNGMVIFKMANARGYEKIAIFYQYLALFIQDTR